MKTYAIIVICIVILIVSTLFTNNKIEYFNGNLNIKQQKFKKCLTDMKKILKQNNTPFFLCWGTLLGQYRENQFIEHDHDIDIGIIRENFDKSIKDIILQSGLFKFEYEYGELNKNYEISFTHLETKIPIDIFIFYNIDNDLYYTSTHTDKCNNTKYGFCKWARHLRGFKNTNFMGETYQIPKNTEEYLEESYGKNWRIPIKFNYQQGLNNNHYKNMMQ